MSLAVVHSRALVGVDAPPVDVEVHLAGGLGLPLETGRITISRAARQANFPADFQLTGAMTPCPCGQLGDPAAVCQCTPDQIPRYLGRIFGPLLDRIDMHLEVPRPPQSALRASGQTDEASATVRARVVAARDRALARYGAPNAAVAGGARWRPMSAKKRWPSWIASSSAWASRRGPGTACCG